MLAITLTRCVQKIIKLVDGRGQAALTGHCLSVPTTGMEAYTGMSLPHTDVHTCFSIAFVGNLNKWLRIAVDDGRHLIQAYGQHFSINYEEILIWLHFLKNNNPDYAGIIVDDSETTRNYFNGLMQLVFANAHIADSLETVAIEESTVENHPHAPSISTPASTPQTRAPCISTPSSTPILMEEDTAIAGEVDTAPALPPFGAILEAALELELPNGGDEWASSVLRSVLEQLPVLLEDPIPVTTRISPEVQEMHVDIGLENQAMNEYTEYAKIMNTSFPYLFPFGCPWNTCLTKTETYYLLLQASNEFASAVDFCCFLFNQRARATASIGVSALWKNSPDAIASLTELITADGFVEELTAAAAAPNSLGAKRIMSVILPLLLAGGKNVPYGNTGQGERAAAEMLNMARFFGNGAFFFTSNPNIQEHVLSLRLSTPIVSNEDTSGALFTYPPESWERKNMMAKNPLGASLGYLFFDHVSFINIRYLP
jgi:hypothetical protein